MPMETPQGKPYIIRYWDAHSGDRQGEPYIEELNMHWTGDLPHLVITIVQRGGWEMEIGGSKKWLWLHAIVSIEEG